MSIKAVIDLTGAQGRAAAGNALESRQDFITKYAYDAQGREYRNEANFGLKVGGPAPMAP